MTSADLSTQEGSSSERVSEVALPNMSLGRSTKRVTAADEVVPSKRRLRPGLASKTGCDMSQFC